MSASAALQLSPFALDVLNGLTGTGQKRIPPRYFYDDLGSTLFEAITLLPEYGLTRADERLLRTHAPGITGFASQVPLVIELGSGSGRKTRHVLQAIRDRRGRSTYCPIDVSSAALDACSRELSNIAQIHPICGDWMEGVHQALKLRPYGEPVLLLFLGSSIGNLDREEIASFLHALRHQLRPGDFFLLGADLVKDIDVMLTAYDDPIGVTAAFNRNLLSRINRELSANFVLPSFAHEARWNADEQRIEMHLRSCRAQSVSIGTLERSINFSSGETIWTESSHKFTPAQLDRYAHSHGFRPVRMWLDSAWPFAECLWEAVSTT